MSTNILSPFETSLSQERRREIRARIGMRIRVRNAEFGDGDISQITDTINASRRGLYFQSELNGYHKGMRLRVTAPYNAAVQIADLEELCEVIRMDRKPHSPVGIAVRRPVPGNPRNLQAVHRNERSAAMAERRSEQRFSCTADVEIADLQTRAVVKARISDLSMSGCYIDTLNPFPAGQLLDLSIQKDKIGFKVRASVRTQHLGSGMGLAFADLPREEYSIVGNWLSEFNPNGGGRRATESGIHMSRVFDALREAEQKNKRIAQTGEQPEAVATPAPSPIASPAAHIPELAVTTAAYIGPGIKIRGEITGNESLHIDGTVDGLISLGDCRLTIGHTGHVSGQILAGEIAIYGQVDGDVEASERIIINKQACVSGELTTNRIMIEDGAYLKATVQIEKSVLAEPVV